MSNKFEKTLNTLNNNMSERCQNEFSKIFESFMEKHKDVERVIWTQYTTYFNDGEPCNFNVGYVCLKLTKEARSTLVEEDTYDQADYEDFLDDPNESDSDILDQSIAEQKSLSDDFDDLSRAIGANESLMLFSFGDHAMVVADRDGISVTEYFDHD